MMIPAISLHEVWASAMRLGLKKYETRDDIPIWRSKYRGPIAVHHAKKKFKPEEYDADWIQEITVDGLLDDLLYGVVSCIVDLVEIRKSESMDYVSEVERRYGNYEPNRLVLVTQNLRVLPQPIPFKGHQGWIAWPVPQEHEHLAKGDFKLL